MARRALVLLDLVDGRSDDGAGDLAERVRAHDTLIRRTLAAHGGTEIDKTDGFLLLFDEVAAAVDWAEAVHREMAADPAFTGLSVRIGVHAGDVEVRRNPPDEVARGAKPLEVEGVAKPITARIASVAQGGQTLISQPALRGLEPGELRAVPVGSWRMKGVRAPLDLFEIGHPDRAALVPPPDGKKVVQVSETAAGWVPTAELPSTVPVRGSAFFGRRRLLRALADALDAGPRVALVGETGSGRTRLAECYAERFRGAWPGGTWLVDAHGCTGAVALRAAVARDLGLAPEGLERALAAGDRRLVLLLGAETMDPVAWEAANRLASVEGPIRWLAPMDRARPGWAGVAVGPLPADQAAALFTARALAANPDFWVTDDVETICELLGRLPGPIEQTAARARVLNGARLVRRLGGQPTARARQEASARSHAESAEAVTRVVVVSDVVGSTALTSSLGPARTARMWERHDQLARAALAELGGLEIDRTDGFVLLFEDLAPALAFGERYHAALAQVAGELDAPVSARLGLVQGEVVLLRNSAEAVARGAKPLDVVGGTKRLAEQVMSLAPGGRTLVTGRSRGALGPHVDLGWWRLDAATDPLELLVLGDAPVDVPDAPSAYRVHLTKVGWEPSRPPENNLPPEADRFFGREAELARLRREVVDGATLLTLLGPGGAGKSRVTRQFARLWCGGFPGGAWFADLTQARDLASICVAVAGAMGIELSASDPAAQIGHALRGPGASLLLLDNFEQVAEHAAATVGRWQALAPSTVFLVSSRRRLALDSERVVPVEALGMPDGEASLDDLRANDAVRMLADRAGLAVEAENAESLGALVRLVDGLPLAIELTAARVQELGLAEVRERVEARTAALGEGPRSDAVTQAVAWSWSLLSDPERAVLAQCTAFAGGFTLDAAEAVVALPDGSPELLDVVQALVDRSLFRRLPRHGARADIDEPWLGMYVSVRDFAADQLRAPAAFPGSGRGAEAQAWVRHGAWYARMGGLDGYLQVRGRGGMALLRERRLELDNLQAALRRAVDRGDADVAVRLLWALASVLDHMGPYGVLVAVARAVVAMPGLPPVGRAEALAVLGRGLERAKDDFSVLEVLAGALEGARAHAPRLVPLVQWWRQDALRAARDERAVEAVEEGLELAERHGLPGVVGSLLVHKAIHLGDAGRGEEAHAVYLEALRVAVASGDEQVRLAVESLLLLFADKLGLHPGDLRPRAQKLVEDARAAGARDREVDAVRVLARSSSSLEEKIARLEVALAIVRRIGDRGRERQVLYDLSRALLWAGDPRALDLIEHGHALAREGEPGARMDSHNVFAQALQNAGRHDESLAHARSAVALARSFGNPLLLTYCLYGLGELLLALRRWDDLEPVVSELLELGRDASLVRIRMFAEALAGRVRVEQGRTEEGRRHLEASLEHSKATEASDRIYATAYLGRGLHRCGDLDGARRLLAEVLPVLRDRDPQDCALFLAWLAEVEVDAGAPALARAHLDEAEGILAQRVVRQFAPAEAVREARRALGLTS